MTLDEGQFLQPRFPSTAARAESDATSIYVSLWIAILTYEIDPRYPNNYQKEKNN